MSFSMYPQNVYIATFCNLIRKVFELNRRRVVALCEQDRAHFSARLNPRVHAFGGLRRPPDKIAHRAQDLSRLRPAIAINIESHVASN